MRTHADIAVYDENDQISALVEVKAVPESSPHWAAQVRRNILGETGFAPPFFLVVARDRAYVWTKAAPFDALPNQNFRTDDLFERYLDYIKSDSTKIDPSALELMVGIWLSDMASNLDRGAKAPQLEEIGLRSAVANGRVEFLTAA